MSKVTLRLPAVQSCPATRPRACPHCGSSLLQRHQAVRKVVRDPQVAQVVVVRYRCTGCGRTFRHYPEGVTCADQSQRLVALAALFWALGLSHARVALVLGVFGVVLGRMSVWRDVQALGQALRRRGRARVAVLGVDGTLVRRRGRWEPVVVAVDVGTGQVVELALLDERDPQAVLAWLRLLVQRLGVEVVVSDDLESYRQGSRRLGLRRQGCVAHLRRWVRVATAELAAQVEAPWQPVVEEVRAAVRELGAAGGERLGQCWLAMHAAREEHRGRLPAAVRLRRLVQRLGRDWPSYRVWAERADVPATNNRTEQGIGRLKVRARTVRGYQSAEGLLNGSMLAAAVGGPGMPDLAALLSAS